MSLLSVVQDVCEVVGVERPSTVFGNINAQRTQQELLALANDMAQQVAYDNRDWMVLLATQTIAGDGVRTSFPLANDFYRIIVDGNVWTSAAPQTPLAFINSYDEWVRRTAANYWNYRGQYMFAGGNIMIQPALGAGTTASFGYVRKNIINLASGGVGDVFTSDGDSFVLQERLLRLGMIWKWKSNKGSAYAEDMGTYQDAIMMAMGRDKPAPILIGGRPASQAIGATVAYPFLLPTP